MQVKSAKRNVSIYACIPSPLPKKSSPFQLKTSVKIYNCQSCRIISLWVEDQSLIGFEFTSVESNLALSPPRDRIISSMDARCRVRWDYQWQQQQPLYILYDCFSPVVNQFGFIRLIVTWQVWFLFQWSHAFLYLHLDKSASAISSQTHRSSNIKLYTGNWVDRFKIKSLLSYRY